MTEPAPKRVFDYTSDFSSENADIMFYPSGVRGSCAKIAFSFPQPIPMSIWSLFCENVMYFEGHKL